MPKLTEKPTDVSVTFRMTAAGHEMLMREVGRCGCNLSSFLRYAVMTEIATRHDDRNRNKKVAQLLRHNELMGVDDAQNNA